METKGEAKHTHEKFEPFDVLTRLKRPVAVGAAALALSGGEAATYISSAYGETSTQCEATSSYSTCQTESDTSSDSTTVTSPSSPPQSRTPGGRHPNHQHKGLKLYDFNMHRYGRVLSNR